MAVDTELEKLMGYLGEFGKYQKIQFGLHLLAALTAGIHMLSLVTVAAVPSHRCLTPLELQTNETLPWNAVDVIEWIPRRGDGLDNCKRLVEPGGNETEACTQWAYDPTYYPSTRTKEWNMVCDRRWMGAVAQSAYMLGVFTGAVTLGSLADRIGRKKVLYASCVLQLVLGVLVAFVPEFYTFLLIRYLFGIFGSAGAYNTAFVMSGHRTKLNPADQSRFNDADNLVVCTVPVGKHAMELVGSSKRTPCGLSFQGMFAFGMILVAFWGWLVPNRFYLQIIYGCHSLLLLGHWWLVDESPRWLWAHGKRDEAIRIVRKGLKINGDDTGILDDGLVELKPMMQKMQEPVEEAGILSLFKTPNLRKRTLNVCLNWFANSLAYYGLSLNTGSLPGNPFLMLFINAAVELPSYVLTTYLMDKLGRRSVIAVFMLLGGLACIVSACIPTEEEAGRIGVITVVMMGKLLLAGSFAIIFNYTAELFPTVVRNTAIGVGSMCARLSGALAPMFTLLDSLNKTLPIMIFASIALISGLLSLLLPETLDQPMPQSIEDGERFGEGDTACATCYRRKKKEDYSVPLSTVAES